MAKSRKQSEKMEAPAEATIEIVAGSSVDQPAVIALPKELQSMIDTTEDLGRMVARLQKDFDALKAEYLAKLIAGENPVSIGILMREKTLEMSAMLISNSMYFTTSIPALLGKAQNE